MMKRLALALILAPAAMLLAAGDSAESLTQKLWPKDRLDQAAAAVEQQRKDGLLSDAAYAKRKQLLEDRRAGRFKPSALSTEDPPLNFIQNGGFEQVNRNSRPNRSRWLWWGGWDWGGDYENRWEDRPQHVHSGQFSARVECKGAKGRIGINTPPLPVVPGAAEYRLTLWAKGAGDNELFINFEEGVTGTLRAKMPEEWTKVTVTGKPAGDKDTYNVYLYVTGAGTIWLDDVSLVPVGGNMEE